MVADNYADLGANMQNLFRELFAKQRNWQNGKQHEW